MKVSFIKTLALTSGFACLAALSVGPAMAGDKDIAPGGKTRAEVRAEYLQAVQDGTLPNTTELDETTYRAMMARGFSTKRGNATAQAPDLGSSPAGTPLSATAPSTSPLTREAVRADTIEWLRLHRGDVQMGGQ